MEIEAMKKILSAVEKSIHDLSAKQDLTPQETRACLDGMQLRDLLLCEIEYCKQEEHSERAYSMHGDVPYRRYNITAYHDRPTSVMRSDRSYCGEYGMYDDPMYYSPDFYGAYGRVPHGSVSTRYSRHSIGDRAVEKLEQMMDTAGSEYEKEELHKFIRMIRQTAD